MKLQEVESTEERFVVNMVANASKITTASGKLLWKEKEKEKLNIYMNKQT